MLTLIKQKLSHDFLILGLSAYPQKQYKYFGYNLLKGRDPCGNWRQLGVHDGSENSGSTEICAHFLLCSFHGERMLDLHPYFSLMLASKCGYVTGFDQLYVKGILYANSRLIWFHTQMQFVFSLDTCQLDVNINGDLETLC